MTLKELFDAWYHPNFFSDPKPLAWEAWKQSRKNLEAEQAQAVEPAMYKYEHIYGYLSDQYSETQWNATWVENWLETKLYAHPAPPATGERAELIARLRSTAYQDDEVRAHAREAADMLEADAQANKDAFAAGMSCRPASAQQVAVPALMTDTEVFRAAKTVQSVFERLPNRDVIEFARAIEAHHGIGAKP